MITMEKTLNVQKVKLFLSTFTLVPIYGVFLLLLAFTTPDFFNAFNLRSTVTFASILGFLVIGETLVILTRGIDLSVGSIASLSTVITAALMKFYGKELNYEVIFFLCFALSTLAGLGIGTINGLFVSYLNVPPFISTLSGLLIGSGFAYFILRGVPTTLAIASFRNITRGRILFMPIPFLVLLAVSILFWYLLTRTSWGRYIYAVGGNEYASFLSGIDTKKVVLSAYQVSGILAAIGGVMLAALSNAGFPRAAEGYEFRAITAAVIGGVSLSGGEGNLFSALLGIFILTTLGKSIIFWQISPFMEGIFIGGVLLAAMYASVKGRKRR